jgi:hypothetical protein
LKQHTTFRQALSDVSHDQRDLICDDQKQVAAGQLRALIAEGLASGAPVPAGRKYWTSKRKELRKTRLAE